MPRIRGLLGKGAQQGGKAGLEAKIRGREKRAALSLCLARGTVRVGTEYRMGPSIIVEKSRVGGGGGGNPIFGGKKKKRPCA